MIESFWQSWGGPAAAFAASLFWAFGVNVYSDLSNKYTPSRINFSRAIVSGPFFLVGALIASQWGITFADVLWIAVSCISSYALGDLLFLKSTKSKLQVSGALAIASIYPIWSTLFSFVFLKSALSFLNAAGLVLVVASTIGVILESGSEKSPLKKSEGLQMSVRSGAWLALLVSIFWAMNTFSISQVPSLNSFVTNTVRMALAMLLCPLFGFLINNERKLLLEKEDFKKALPIFVLEGFGGSLAFVHGVSQSSAAVGAILTSLAPVLSIPIYSIRHRVRPNARKSIAILIVIVGLALLLNK